jgi:hypothetical protein
MLACISVAVVAPLAVYVAAYCFIGERWDEGGGHVGITYQQDWQLVAFRPARDAESRLRGTKIQGVKYQPFTFFFGSTR